MWREHGRVVHVFGHATTCRRTMHAPVKRFVKVVRDGARKEYLRHRLLEIMGEDAMMCFHTSHMSHHTDWPQTDADIFRIGNTLLQDCLIRCTPSKKILALKTASRQTCDVCGSKHLIPFRRASSFSFQGTDRAEKKFGL